MTKMMRCNAIIEQPYEILLTVTFRYEVWGCMILKNKENWKCFYGWKKM